MTSALHALAHRHGVQVHYTDHRGRRRRAADDTLVAVLDSLGVPPSGGPGAGGGGGAATPARVLEPVLVRRAGGGRRVYRVTLPPGADPAATTVRVDLEDGTSASWPLSALGTDRSGATRFRLPPVPDGYHRLWIEGPGVAASALLVAAPARCPQPRRGWGVVAPLHAVRTPTDWGVASYRDLDDLGRWVAGLGGSFVGTLPAFASYLEGPRADPSPYRPVSRLAWNELYVDVESLPELVHCPEARRLLGSPALGRRRARLRGAELADPCASMAAKRPVLELLAAAVPTGDPARRDGLAAFVATHPEVLAYARFRAAVEAGGRLPSAGGRWARRRQPGEDPRVGYHLYVQWVADAQLADVATGTGLYVDLPVGVHPDGFDPWWYPESFVAGASVGAPPDDFFSAGQAWGLSPLHPVGLREAGYGYLVAALRHALRHADVVRIDHVMGLHRLWFVPDGMSAAAGAYVHYRADEVRAIVVLEAARAQAAVVGEDLGTVPAAVRRALRRDGMLHSHVAQFAATPDDPFPDAPEDALASLGTHDLAPFAAWWAGTDIDDRVARGLTEPAEAAAEQAGRAALRRATAAARPAGAGRGRALSASQALRASLEHLAAGPARLLVVDPPDLWGERQPQNRPGTGDEEGNFRHRWTRIWPDDLATARSGVPGALRRLDRARRSRAARSSDPTGERGPT